MQSEDKSLKRLYHFFIIKKHPTQKSMLQNNNLSERRLSKIVFYPIIRLAQKF